MVVGSSGWPKKYSLSPEHKQGETLTVNTLYSSLLHMLGAFWNAPLPPVLCSANYLFLKASVSLDNFTETFPNSLPPDTGRAACLPSFIRYHH